MAQLMQLQCSLPPLNIAPLENCDIYQLDYTKEKPLKALVTGPSVHPKWLIRMSPHHVTAYVVPRTTYHCLNNQDVPSYLTQALYNMWKPCSSKYECLQGLPCHPHLSGL